MAKKTQPKPEQPDNETTESVTRKTYEVHTNAGLVLDTHDKAEAQAKIAELKAQNEKQIILINNETGNKATWTKDANGRNYLVRFSYAQPLPE